MSFADGYRLPGRESLACTSPTSPSRDGSGTRTADCRPHEAGVHTAEGSDSIARASSALCSSSSAPTSTGLSRQQSRSLKSGSSFRYHASNTGACRRLEAIKATFAVLLSDEFRLRAEQGEGAEVVQVLNAMPGELMVKMVRECVADAWLVDGTLEELQDLLDTEGVRSVDLQGCEVRGRQGKVLHMRRPGLTLRDGTLDLRGGVVRCWFRSGRGGDEWVGLLVQGDGCRLEGVAVTGVREPGVGVAFQNARGCVAEGCRVASTAGTGIWVVGERSTLVATDCEVVDNGGRGVTVSDGATADLSRCLVRANKAMGLECAGSGSSLTSTDTQVEKNLSYGALVRDGGACVVRDSRMCGNGRDGALCVGSGSTLRLEGCEVSGNVGSGVTADDGGEVSLVGSGNRLEDNGNDPFTAIGQGHVQQVE